MVGIENFKMPKSCRECPCMSEFMVAYDEKRGCVFTHRTYNWGLPGRPTECPLIEITEDEDDLK